MSARFASNKRAIADCDICGFQYKLRTLRDLIVKGNNTNLKACNECWNPDHPQLKLGEFPVDPFDLTPNTLLATGSVGTVTITV